MIQQASQKFPDDQRQDLLGFGSSEGLMSERQWNDVGNAFNLTTRENQVCQRLFLGETRDAIADHLEIKPRTVRHYLESIHKKMNVKNRVGVVLRLVEARDYLDKHKTSL